MTACSVGYLNLWYKTSLVPSQCVFRFLDDLIPITPGPVLPLVVAQLDILVYRRCQLPGYVSKIDLMYDRGMT